MADVPPRRDHGRLRGRRRRDVRRRRPAPARRVPRELAGGTAVGDGGVRAGGREDTREAPMVKHIVFWTLKPSAGEGAAEEVRARLEGLRGLVQGMLAFEVGIDFSRT